jgi:hypothetical protein
VNGKENYRACIRDGKKLMITRDSNNHNDITKDRAGFFDFNMLEIYA